MNYIQKITKVRERGQLRVPISHPQHPKKKLTKEEWIKIWEDMKKISKLGKQGVNLTEFLRHDRDTH